MSILDRSALEASPLADLHTIASELAIDGYRRLRRAELIDAIVDKQAGEEPSAEPAPAPTDEPPRSVDEDLASAVAEEMPTRDDEQPATTRRRRGRRERASAEPPEAESEPAPAAEEEEIVEGVVEVLPNGSGFVRLNPPEPSDQDLYISAAQVKRCDLVSGDRVTGPRRPPRRAERFASLARVDTIDGRPAAEVTGTVRFDDLPAAFPDRRLALGSADEALGAIESVTPIGHGSRVTIVGPSPSGKTETLRRVAAALSSQDDLRPLIALAGVRPEEIPEWAIEPAAAVSFAAATDAQIQAVESVVDQARRLAARGMDVVVLIDSLTGLPPHVARRAIAAARNIIDGGSLTVIATSRDQIGGETTVIALDSAAPGRLDPDRSWTLHPERLLGD